MIKKTIALSLSILSLGFGFMVKGSALSVEDESSTTSLQQQETIRNKKEYRIKQIRTEIEENEIKIKNLEIQKSELDRLISRSLRLKGCYLPSDPESKILQKDIYSMSSIIKGKESEINKLKEEISNLDQELTVLLQLQER